MIVGRDSGTLSAARTVKHVKQLQVRAVFTQVVNIYQAFLLSEFLRARSLSNLINLLGLASVSH